MFKELTPFLRQRAVLLTITRADDDEIRVNIVPQKLKEGENAALTTPLSVTGTAEELDRDLPAAIVDFVAAHLQLKNTLDRAKEEMDTAAKAAKAEARAKTVKAAGKELPKPGAPASAEMRAPAPAPKETPAKPGGLSDAPVSGDAPEDEPEVPTEPDDEETEEEPLDDAA